MSKRKTVPVRKVYNTLLSYMMPPKGTLYVKVRPVRIADYRPEMPAEAEDYIVDLHADPEEVINTILEGSKLLPEFYSNVEMWRQFRGGKLRRTIWGKGVSWAEPSKDVIGEMRELLEEWHTLDEKNKILTGELIILWLTAPFRKIVEFLKKLTR
jgi:hypothetical protein